MATGLIGALRDGPVAALHPSRWGRTTSTRVITDSRQGGPDATSTLFWSGVRIASDRSTGMEPLVATSPWSKASWVCSTGKIDEANSQPSAEGIDGAGRVDPRFAGSPRDRRPWAQSESGRRTPRASRPTTQVCASAASFSIASGALVTSRCCVMRATRSASQCSELCHG